MGRGCRMRTSLEGRGQRAQHPVTTEVVSFPPLLSRILWSCWDSLVGLHPKLPQEPVVTAQSCSATSRIPSLRTDGPAKPNRPNLSVFPLKPLLLPWETFAAAVTDALPPPMQNRAHVPLKHQGSSTPKSRCPGGWRQRMGRSQRSLAFPARALEHGPHTGCGWVPKGDHGEETAPASQPISRNGSHGSSSSSNRAGTPSTG